jgi:3-isopropylmalate dehydrogenase
MTYKIALIPGDGIGPEVTAQAVRVLEAVGLRFGHSFQWDEALMGGAAIDAAGVPLPEETLRVCRSCDAVLLGAVGGPKWEEMPEHLRPEAGLLGLRAGLGLYANLRPAKLFTPLRGASPLRPGIVGDGFDFIFVRELTGGIYFGKRGREGDAAYDTERYTTAEVERVGRAAFGLARERRRKLRSVDKANVLESSRLWREVMHRLREEFPDVEYGDMLVDNAAMQLVRDPGQFDVIVTSNMFGDILSDEAAMLTGSIGMLPSASLGTGRFGLYEPIHGSAPDIAGQGKANPLAAVLSAAMLLRLSLGLTAEADVMEGAVEYVLAGGYRTGDIARGGEPSVSTGEMGRLVAEKVSERK